MIKMAYLKNLNRTFRANWVRMLIIASMTAISIGLVGGVGALSPRIRATHEYLRNSIDWEALTEAEYAFYTEWLYGIEFAANGMEQLSFVFPAFFILVTCLVVFMTITRMIETERVQIGIMKTLGYSRHYIVFKYMAFTLVAGIIGNVIGVVLAHYAVQPVLFNAVISHFSLDSGTAPAVPVFDMVTALLMLGFMLGVTGFTVHRIADAKPARLLRPRSPKAGGKIIIEHFPALWNRLAFRYKSSLRNIFRYRVRLFMTVFSMLFSTALVFMGLALSFAMEYTDPEIMGAIRPISSMIIVCAVLLNAMVIYNITNINIDERRREIATLKVLGYRNIEVVGYVYREILMLTVIGVVLGLPVGYGLMAMLFDMLDFGGIQYVKWYVWVITTALTLTSLALADLLLFRKIHKTDMVGCLKHIE